LGQKVIPRKLHIVWVGDESKRPDNCITTWQNKNLGWEIKVWGNADLSGQAWRNAHHMETFAKRQEWCGVADLMRYEILYEHGGFAIDADCVCLQPLPSWLLEASEFCCYENEIDRPGLLANGYLAAGKGSAFIGQIIEDIHADKLTDDLMAWQFSGPARLTEVWERFKYPNLTIYPSHYFVPEHFAGQRYTGAGHVFARQFWGSTRKVYDSLYMQECVDERE
jgi:mannosyltransferase OCH1-like enzyme